MPISILMPALSPTMEEGKLAKWLVKEGDNVSSGDIIAEIETDKATMEFEAVDEGVVGKILVAEGTEGVKVNNPICILLEDGESADDIGDVEAPPVAKKEETPTKEAPKEEKETSPAPKATTPQPPAPKTGDHIAASPLAKRIAKDKNINLATVQGSGPRGRIVKADVENIGGASTNIAMPAPSGAVDARSFYAPDSYEEVPLDTMRATIARRLTEAKQQIPHYYLSMDCRLDELLEARKRINEKLKEGKVSVNDFLMKATARALMDHPFVNASWAENAILQHKHADISVAVAIEGGLITPIIRAVEQKGLIEISQEVKDMATRARERRLNPDEYEGGSFSISNLGMFGIHAFSAVINPPQAAILAIGAGEKRA
ncbi:MAG: pyruvate dehydrogenase complex dihydrolipoamide acetyltransferase, partial [Parvibaculales bacterium]